MSSCCGELGSRFLTIKKVTEALVAGHRGLAMMYRNEAKLASDVERVAFEEAASKQDVLAVQSEEMVLPDGVNLEELGDM